MAGFRTLLVREAEGALLVALDRPEARNAISAEMVGELHQVCESLEQAPRTLVITGKGGVFASGADIRELRERRRDDALVGINSALFIRIARLPMPVIAAIDGPALGGGAELAYAADLRIGTPRLKIGNPETSLGIVAAAGGAWRLRELVGEPLAKQMLLAGRTLDGSEALAAGLVSELHGPEELEAAALALAARIGKQDPLALRITKEILGAPRDAHPLVDRLAQAILFESDEKSARMQRFIDRKTQKDHQP